MTQSPSPLPSSTPPDDRNRWAKWLRLGLLGGGGMLLLIVVGTLIARSFVYRRLGPIVETSIGALIDRPVEIGPITGFSLTGIQIDGAAIPPTVEDEDYAKVPKVEVGFNPVAVVINLVRDRTLPITLTFSDPELYLQEDEDGHWVELEIKQPEQEAPISLALETIKANNATVIVAPFPQSAYDLPDTASGDVDPVDASVDALSDSIPIPIANPVTLVDIDVLAHLRDENRYLDADITGKAAGGGRFELKSDVDFKQLRVNAHLRSHDIQVTPFNDLVKAFAPLPATLQAGAVDTNITVRYNKAVGVSCEGTVQVNDVEAMVDLVIPNVEFQPISEVNSLVGCSGQTLTLSNTALNYGTLPIQASGSVDLESGYDLTAQVPKLTLAQIQDTVTVEVPVELQGAVGATATVSGPLAQPLVTGEVRNLEPIQVDKLVADTVSVDFKLTPSLLDITQLTVLPAVGGTINGKGQVTFQGSDGLLFDAEVQDVPTDAIASLYGVTLPEPFQLGGLNSTLDVFGDFSNIQAAVKWSLPNATYPGQGDVLYGDQLLRVRNTTIQVPGGNLDVIANASLPQEKWDATVALDGVDVPSLLTQMQITPPQGVAVQGILSSDITLGGNFRQLTPEAIALRGRATLAGAEVALAGSPVLDQGDWNTAFRWTGQDLVVEQFKAPGVIADGVISTNLQGPPTLDTLITQMNVNVTVEPYDLQRLQAFVPANLHAQLTQQVAPLIAAPIYPQGQAQFQGTITGTLTRPQLNGIAQLDNFSVASFQFAPTLAGAVNFALGEGGTVDLKGGDDLIYARLNERYLPSAFELRNGDVVAGGNLEGDRLTASIESLDVSRFGIRPLARPDLGPVRGVVNLDLDANLANLADPRVNGQVAIAQPGLGTIVAEGFTGELSYRDGIAILDDGYFCLGPDRSEWFEEMTSDVEVTINDIDDSRLVEQCEGKSQFRLASVVNVFDLAVEQSQLTIENAHVQDVLTTLQWFDIDDAIRWLDFNAPTFTANLDSGAADVDANAVALPPPPLLNRPSSWERNSNLPIDDQLGFFAQWLEQWDQTQKNSRPFVPALQDLNGQFEGVLSLEGSAKTGFNLNFNVMGDRWTWGQYEQETQFTASGSASPNAIIFKSPLQLTSGTANVLVEGEVGLKQSGTTTVEVQNVPVELVRGVAQQFVPALETLPIDLSGTLHTQATLEGTVFTPKIEGTVEIEDPQLQGQSLEQAVVNFTYDQARLDADSTIALQNQEKLTVKANIPYALPFMDIQPLDDHIEINANVRDEGLALMNLFTQGQAIWESGTGEVSVDVSGTLSTPLVVGTLELEDGQISSPLLTQPITGITGEAEFDLTQVIIKTFQAQLGDGNVAVQGQLPLFAAANTEDTTIGEPTSKTTHKNTGPKAEADAPVSDAPVSDAPLEETPDGLTIDVNALPLNVKKFLSAIVDGKLLINGAAIAPIISGDIGVFRGQVNVAEAATLGKEQEKKEEEPEIEIGETETDAGDTEAGAEGESSEDDVGDSEDVQTPNPFLAQVTLDGLKVTLADQLQIANRPLFDLEAIGGLMLTGTLADPRAQGDIELASGWINLFATQFRLDRNEDHIAQFRSTRSLMDPILRVAMNAVVREVERSPVPPSSPFARPEVSDQSSIPTFGGLQSVIITARVNGSAQNLLAHLSDPNNPSPNPLTLTSSPSRSERQLVALLGGEIFSALESGNTGLAIASYVGSGFVAGVGDQIADALGLSEFSIFPTTDISGESRLPLTVGVEAGLDIIPQRLSFSILEILDGTTNPQYGLQYRLSNQWQVRGSSDLNQDNRVILEFRNDF